MEITFNIRMKLKYGDEISLNKNLGGGLPLCLGPSHHNVAPSLLLLLCSCYCILARLSHHSYATMLTITSLKAFYNCVNVHEIYEFHKENKAIMSWLNFLKLHVISLRKCSGTLDTCVFLFKRTWREEAINCRNSAPSEHNQLRLFC